MTTVVTLERKLSVLIILWCRRDVVNLASMTAGFTGTV